MYCLLKWIEFSVKKNKTLKMLENGAEILIKSGKFVFARPPYMEGRSPDRPPPPPTETPRGRYMGPDRDPPGKNVGPQTGSDIILRLRALKKGGGVGMMLHWT